MLCVQNPTFMLEGCRASCLQCQSKDCHDKDPNCQGWADSGECGRNGDFMLSTCAFSCGVCDVSFKPACKRDPAEAPAAVGGTDLKASASAASLQQCPAPPRSSLLSCSGPRALLVVPDAGAVVVLRR